MAYLAAWDVHHARIFGRCEPTTGIAPFGRLVGQVMTTEPYASARRASWVVDNGSSHRGQASADRIRNDWPTARLVHLPIHSSWLNQIEIYFSILQRKVLTPNDFTDLVSSPRPCPSPGRLRRVHDDARTEDGPVITFLPVTPCRVNGDQPPRREHKHVPDQTERPVQPPPLPPGTGEVFGRRRRGRRSSRWPIGGSPVGSREPSQLRRVWIDDPDFGVCSYCSQVIVPKNQTGALCNFFAYHHRWYPDRGDPR